MAGDWIPARVDLHDDPAVISMARTLRMDEFSVVGRLFAVWGWAQSVSADGIIAGADARTVDRKADKKGFAAAMAATPGSPWLIIGDGSVVVPRFDRWLGGAAKRRLQDVQRKREQRDDGHDAHSWKTPNRSADCPQDVRSESGQNAGQKADATVTKGKDRKEEKEKNTPFPPPGESVVLQGEQLKRLIDLNATALPAKTKRSKSGPYVAKHPDTLRLVEHLAEAWPRIQPDGIPPGPTDGNLKAGDRLVARFGASAVAALIDFFADGYRPSDDGFDWRPNFTGLTYIEAKWVKLDAARRKQLGLGQPAPIRTGDGGPPASGARRVRDIAASGAVAFLVPDNRGRREGITS